MKIKSTFVVLMCLTVGAQSSRQTSEITPSIRISSVKPFATGERLVYSISYGPLTAGEAIISVDNIQQRQGKNIAHMVGIGYSKGMFEWFFRVRDRYETYYDIDNLEPIEFIRDVNEGGFIIKHHIFFDPVNNTAVDILLDKNKVFQLEDRTQDIFSAFYYARFTDIKSLIPGAVIQIPVFLDHEMFKFQIRYVGEETIKTKFGKINCLKFKPIVQKGRVFKDEDTMTIWVSNDDNKVPVLIKTELLVGSLKAELIQYEGLKNKSILP